MFSTGVATFVISIFFSLLLYLIFVLTFYQFNFGDRVRNIIGFIIMTFCFSFCSWYISSRKWSVNSLFINVTSYIILALVLIRDSYNNMGSAFGFFISGASYESFLGIHLLEVGFTGFPRNIYLTTFLWFLPLIGIFYFSRLGLKKQLLCIKSSNKKDQIIISIATLMLLGNSFLIFGNPQTSKYHYISQIIFRLNIFDNNDFPICGAFESYQEIQNGVWCDWYINGNKKTEMNYKNGKRNGKCIGWFINGAKEFEETWENDYIIRKGWYINGSKKFEVTWRKGIAPLSIEWKENGDIMTEEEKINRLKQIYSEN